MGGKFAEFIRNWWFMGVAVMAIGAWCSRVDTCMNNLSHDVKEMLQLQRQIDTDLQSFAASTTTWIEVHKEVHKKEIK